MRGLFTNLRLRWRALWKRRQLETDLEDELAFHLAMREQKNREAGQAESSQRSFGNPALVKEDLRDQWTFRTFENFWRDLRYAGRMLRKSPGFMLIAIFSLAIGIGGNTAIFSVVDAILLRTLPVKAPEQLRMILWTGKKGAPTSFTQAYAIDGGSDNQVISSFPYPTYKQFVTQVPQFSDLMGFVETGVTVNAGPATHPAGVALVSGNFFTGLGVSAIAGRTLVPDDDRESAPAVAMVSYRYWERHLGINPEIIGHVIIANGEPVTIVGVLPKAFLGVQPGYKLDLYLPVAHVRIVGNKHLNPQDVDSAWVQIIGRLRPGAHEQAAIAVLGSVMQRDGEANAQEREATGKPWQPVLEEGARGIRILRDRSLPTLLILSGVVGLVLLIACANLANLLLSRGVARRREIAVRLAIGAGRWRLLRQLLTESIVLAGLGAAIGLAIARPLTALVLHAADRGRMSNVDARLDGRTLLFTAVAALVTAFLFGLMPALRATSVDLTPALKDGHVGSFGPRLGVSRMLIAGQVALSMLLLAGSGLFIRTLMNLSNIDPGFQAQSLLLFEVDGSQSGYKGEKLLNFYERIREKVAAIPGVQSATLSDAALLSGSMSNTYISFPGYKSKKGERPAPYLLRVGDHFLATMRIPLISGRDLDERDADKAVRVGVVNETFARDYLDNKNPVGRFFYFADTDIPRPQDRVEIVGFCKDAKYDRLRNEAPPTVYISYLQHNEWDHGMTFELRTAMPPMAIARAVNRAVASIDQNVPVAEMRTQEEQIRDTLGTERMFAGVVSSFGAIAALLAAIGLYGVMAYAVTRRTSEIGIRLALGATRGDVQWMVLWESLWMVVAGLIVGIPAALGVTRYVRATLYGIRPNDPVSFVVAGALMVAVAGIAAWIPARRAARVDPMRALRCE